MKKILVLALLAFAGVSAQAQMTHYVQASVSWLMQSGQEARNYMPFKKSDRFTLEQGSQAALGFNVLYGLELPLYKGLYWGAEGGIGTSRGMYWGSYAYPMNVKVGGEDTFRSYAIRITPANFGYKHHFNQNWAIDGHVGFGVSYDFAGGRKFSQVDSSGEMTRETSLSDMTNYRRLDVLMKLGVCVSYKHVGLDLSWEKGLVQWDKGSDMFASNICLGVRYIF